MEKQKMIKAGIIVLAVIVLGVFFFKNSASKAERLPQVNTNPQASVIGQCNQACEDVGKICLDNGGDGKACSDQKQICKDQCIKTSGGSGTCMNVDPYQEYQCDASLTKEQCGSIIYCRWVGGGGNTQCSESTQCTSNADCGSGTCSTGGLINYCSCGGDSCVPSGTCSTNADCGATGRCQLQEGAAGQCICGI